MRWMVFLLAMAGAARADGERAGDFDYYVMALSWSPSWCRMEGDARNSPQCDASGNHDWVLHGLWPQNERGWPSFCRTDARNPSRRETGDQEALFGSSGNAWHQWNKHGRCSGLSSANYYRLAREAFGRIERPEVFRKLDRTVSLPASVVEDAFLEVNPGLTDKAITVICQERRISEVRICLTRDLEPRSCGADVSRDCTLRDAMMEPVR